jgi:hypothetical protein
MFKRHRTDPDTSIESTVRDRLQGLAMTARTEPAGVRGLPYSPQSSRGRFGESVAATTGLRNRIRQPALTTHTG